MARRKMSQPEAVVLKKEAERRVRAGQSRAEVGRLLGIHVMTLSQWALAGGWRQVDLERERQEALAGAANRRLDVASEREADEAAERARMEAEAEARVQALAEQEQAEQDAWNPDAWPELQNPGLLPPHPFSMNPSLTQRDLPTGTPGAEIRARALGMLDTLMLRVERQQADKARSLAAGYGDAAQAAEWPALLSDEDIA